MHRHRKEWRVKEVKMPPHIWERLPLELLLMVLAALPLEALLKFRLVSKAWKHLIESPWIAKRQHHGQQVIFYHDPGASSHNGSTSTRRRNMIGSSCLYVFKENSTKWRSSALPFVNVYPIRSRSIVHSEHVLVAVDLGLMCFIKMDICVHFVIYNPLSGHWRELPLPSKLIPVGEILKFTRKPMEYVIVGLSTDQESGNYHLVVATINFHFPFVAFTYNSSSDSWQEFHHVPLEVLEQKKEIFWSVKISGEWKWSFSKSHERSLFWTADVFIGERRVLFAWLQCSLLTRTWQFVCGDTSQFVDVQVECQLCEQLGMALSNWDNLEALFSFLGKVWGYKPLQVNFQGELQHMFVSYLEQDQDTVRMEIRTRTRKRSLVLPRLTIPRDHHVKSLGSFTPTLRAFV